MKIGRGFALAIVTWGFLAGGCAQYGVDVPSFLDPGQMAGARMGKAAAAQAEAPVALAEMPAGPADTSSATRPRAARDVVYSAGFRVVVADVPGSISRVREMAEAFGGYMQEVAGGAITVRVPAAKFDDAVEFIEQVGHVIDRQVKAEDVTDQLRDLRAHLDNQEKLRQRYQALLERAQKVEDALKIEAELARVTEELDKTKGKLRLLESQIAMSTLRVEFNAGGTPNTRGTGPALPFDWVSELGQGLVEGQVQETARKAGLFGHGPRFKPPAAFVRYYEHTDETEAMDATGLRLRVVRRENVDKAPLSFWSPLVRKSLVEGRSLHVDAEESGDTFSLLRGTRQVGGQSVGYLMVLKRNPGHVAVFEAWGPKKLIDEQFESLRASGLSADPG